MATASAPKATGKTAVLLRTLKVIAEGRQGGTSFMEDTRTTCRRATSWSSVPTCSNRPSIASAQPTLEIDHSPSEGRDDPCAQVHGNAGTCRVLGLADLGRHSGSWPTRSTSSSRPMRCQAARRVRGARTVADLRTAAETWLAAGWRPPHRAAWRLTRSSRTSRITNTELVVIDVGRLPSTRFAHASCARAQATTRVAKGL